MSVYFDIFEFLEIDRLTAAQKAKLHQPLLADIAEYCISNFLTSLSEESFASFNRRLDVITDTDNLLNLILETDPQFTTKKSEYLHSYKSQFRLQKFVSCLT